MSKLSLIPSHEMKDENLREVDHLEDQIDLNEDQSELVPNKNQRDRTDNNREKNSAALPSRTRSEIEVKPSTLLQQIHKDKVKNKADRCYDIEENKEEEPPERMSRLAYHSRWRKNFL